MNRRLLASFLVTATLLFVSTGAIAQTQQPVAPQTLAGTAFTYQGQLKHNGSAVNGACDFQFSLWDSASGGVQQGITQLYPYVSVTDGLFTVPIDFALPVFNGDARWLDISVRCPAGGGAFAALSPRQALTPAPMALALPGLYTTQNITSPNIIGGYSGNLIDYGTVGGTISGGGNDLCINHVSSSYATIGGGVCNSAGGNNATGRGGESSFAINGYATVGGGGHNRALGDSATIGGGYVNTASGFASIIGGGFGNTASITYTTIGGGYVNTASGFESTIDGGENNTADGNTATIGGGHGNHASGFASTINGGYINTASGSGSIIGGGISNTASITYTTIGGGYDNAATGFGSTIGGGGANTAGNWYDAIGGGYDNSVSGSFATVPGGVGNIAGGDYSFAAGSNAKANHQGAFVWGDSTNADFASTANNQFLIRATGGVGINTNTPNAALSVSGTVRLNRNDLYLREGTDTNHGLGYYGAGKTFASVPVDGPVLYGYSGGALGTVQSGVQHIALIWTPAGTVSIIRLGSAGSTNLCLNGLNQFASCSSSLRYKNNINDLTLGLGTIAKLHPVTFNWKDSGQADLGFVAEEVNRVTPLLTTVNQEGEIEGVKYDRISAVLVKAVQEQQQQITELKAQNAAQQQEIAQLRSGGPSADQSFNLFNLISVIALGGVIAIGLRQKHGGRS